MRKSILFYLLTISVFGFLVWLIITNGSFLEVAGNDQSALEVSKNVISNAGDNLNLFTESMINNFKNPISIFLLQIIVIVLTARMFGYLAVKIGQPSVIGEIVAGIVLGPSLVGYYFPEFSEFLFAKDSLKSLQFLSQVGLVLFMFIIGMELDLNVLKTKARSAIMISHISIIFPYFLGVLLSYYLYADFAPDGISFLAFALFMGIAMSITAFPVLARIIQEKGLTKTPLGTMAITCAAIDDITAWCILAGVIAIVKAGTAFTAIFTILLTVIYILSMLYLVRPFLKNLSKKAGSNQALNKKMIAITLVILFISAYTSEVIGIHALFGAFMAGIIIPSENNYKKVLTDKIEDISLVVLLPLFFAFTGLRTQIGLLNEGNLWLVCALIIAVAVIGKFGGSTLVAKFTGQSWKDSILLGALMNTRGLMELIVLNIGYDLGILSPVIFAMMVLMALITTFMTGPAFALVNFFSKRLTPKKQEAEMMK